MAKVLARALLVLVIGLAALPAFGKSADDWALEKIKTGDPADFNASDSPCADHRWTPKDSKPQDLSCRSISPDLIIKALALVASCDAGRSPRSNPPPLCDATLERSVQIRNAWVTGDISLENSHITPELEITASHIDGNVLLTGAHFDRLFKLDETEIGDASDPNNKSALTAESLHTEDAVSLARMRVAGDVDLLWANVGGYLSLDSASVVGDLILDAAHVKGSVFLRRGTFNGEADLKSMSVDGMLDMDDVTFRKTLDASGLRIGSHVLMRCLKNQQGKCVTGPDGTLVSGLYLGDVDLRAAEIAGQLAFTGSYFARSVDLHGSHVGTSIWADSRASFEGGINLDLARIDDSVMLGSSNVSGVLNLTSAHIARDLRLIDDSGNHAGWLPDNADTPHLVLRNARVGSVIDSDDAWPRYVDFQGFVYEHPPGPDGAHATAGTGRGVEAWKRWLRREIDPGAQPYAQLATVLAAEGYRDMANDVLFAGREQELEQMWHHAKCDAFTTALRYAFITGSIDTASARPPSFEPDDSPKALVPWNTAQCAGWTLYFGMDHIFGFGIGYYTFRVLISVIVVWIVGVLVLVSGDKTRARGPAWWIAASLDRMLPIVELDESFGKYLSFDNKETDRPNQFQIGYFWVHALLGWVLGLLLVAAISGITQRS